VFDQFIPFIPI